MGGSPHADARSLETKCCSLQGLKKLLKRVAPKAGEIENGGESTMAEPGPSAADGYMIVGAEMDSAPMAACCAPAPRPDAAAKEMKAPTGDDGQKGGVHAVPAPEESTEQEKVPAPEEYAATEQDNVLAPEEDAATEQERVPAPEEDAATEQEKEAARRCKMQALLSKWGSDYIEGQATEPDAQEEDGEQALCLESLVRGARAAKRGASPAQRDASPAGSAMGDTPSCSTMTATPSATADGRMARLMKRCQAEGLQVNHDRAECLLREHEGHVGRVMIALRRHGKRAAAP